MKWWDRGHMKPLYRIVQVAYLAILRVFFKRGYYKGYQNIPMGKPVIVVCNHVNAFQDPILTASPSVRTFHWLVRGDIFAKPFVRFMLESLNQLPIFRPRDGIRNMTKNQDTYANVSRLLKRRAVIMIFAEGDCVPEKRLRPFKKGTARMAFGAAETNGWDSDIHLLPTGVNYTKTDALRSEFMVSIGKVIRLNEYKELYEESAAKAVNKLTADLHRMVKEQMIIIDEPEADEMVEQALVLQRTENAEVLIPWRRNATKRLKREKTLSANLVAMFREKREKADELAHQLSTYFSTIKKHKISDTLFHRNIWPLPMHILALIALFPLAAIGWLLNVVQYRWVMSFTRKKIRKLEFKSSIKIGFLIVINLLLATILGGVLASIGEWWWFFLAYPAWWLLAYVTVIWQEKFRLVKQQLVWSGLSTTEKEAVKVMRQQLVQIIEEQSR